LHLLAPFIFSYLFVSITKVDGEIYSFTYKLKLKFDK